jgi:hypothetical protein
MCEGEIIKLLDVGIKKWNREQYLQVDFLCAILNSPHLKLEKLYRRSSFIPGYIEEDSPDILDPEEREKYDNLTALLQEAESNYS